MLAYWLDEGWHGWPEIDEVGTAAAGLYSRCGSYIADRQTDGFIPSARARMYGTPEWIARLVEVGLWAIEEHGYRDTRYFPLNATRAEIEQRRKAAAERQKRHRERKPKPTKKATRQSRVSNALRDASLTAPPSPASPSGKGQGGAGGPGQGPAGPSGGVAAPQPAAARHPVNPPPPPPPAPGRCAEHPWLPDGVRADGLPRCTVCRAFAPGRAVDAMTRHTAATARASPPAPAAAQASPKPLPANVVPLRRRAEAIWITRPAMPADNTRETTR